MLSFVGDLFQEFLRFISFIWELILHLVHELVYLIDLLKNVVSDLPSYFSWLPASSLGLLVALLAICVLYKVLGRD